MPVPTIVNAKAGALYWAKQPAVSQAPIEADYQQLRWADGRLNAGKETQEIKFIDGDGPFGNGTTVTKGFNGGGQVKIQCDADTLARVLHAALGADAVDGQGVHTIDEGTTYGSPWFTFVQRIGAGATAELRRYADCKITSVEIESNSENPAVIAQLTIVSLRPAIVMDADDEPTDAELTDEPMTYFDASGTWRVAGLNAGAPLAEITQHQFTISTGQQPLQGESLVPYAVGPGDGHVGLGGTMHATDRTMGLVNSVLYGTAAPIAGAEPQAGEFAAPFSVKFTQGASSVELTFPNVEYQIENYPEPSVEAATATIAFKGTARPGAAGAKRLTVTADTKTATAY